MNLQLPLKTNWFEMTEKGIKLEDYREINAYWIRRLFNVKNIKNGYINDMIDYYKNKSFYKQPEDIFLKKINVTKKVFTQNTTTLGYPKKTNKNKIKVYKHLGVEVRAGKKEWGAEEGKFYFVIKHGEEITE